MPPRRKTIWLDYKDEEDPSKVRYNHCQKVISRGKTGVAKAKMSNTGMYQHLASMHPEAEKMRQQREEAIEVGQVEEQEARRARDESGIPDVTVYGLRTKKLRTDFLNMVRFCWKCCVR